MLKIAVLGASGIGKFHAREYMLAGAKVVAILGSSRETSDKTASDLSSEYDMHPKAYFDLDTLIQNESVDAVSICTPPQFHYGQVKKCLMAGLHVMCEKPFVFDSDCHNSELAGELIKLSEEKKLILTVNTQWPSVLKYLKPLVDLSNVKDFFMYMQPPSYGKNMLIDTLSHKNSMLIKLVSGGSAENIEFSITSEGEMDVYFKYRSPKSLCNAHYKFKFKADRPRGVEFSINGIEFKRSIGEGYKQRLITGETVIDIEDPFKASIGMFVDAIQNKNLPLITTEEIIENVQLQDQIIKAYLS